MICYVLQYSNGQFVFVDKDESLYGCELLSQATLFDTKEDANRYSQGRITIRKIVISFLD